MANDQIKKADNGTYYFRANLGFDHSTGKRIQKYKSGFKTKKRSERGICKTRFAICFPIASHRTEKDSLRNVH